MGKLIRILENENWIIDYDKDSKRYRASYFEDNHFVDECWFHTYEDNESRKHGNWFLLEECANAGVYCSICNKKVYKENYANVKIKSKYCPHCGSIMDGEFEIY